MENNGYAKDNGDDDGWGDENEQSYGYEVDSQMNEEVNDSRGQIFG